MLSLPRSFSIGTHGISGAFTRAFPTPRMLFPRAAGLDISDGSIRWLLLAPPGAKERILSYGEEPLPGGVVVNGVIQNIPVFASALENVRKNLPDTNCAHAALPEEAAFVFSMHVPADISREQILNMIEFELPDRVPLAPSASVFDFDVVAEENSSKEIGVSVFPSVLAQSYVDAFSRAGIELLSLELEARSIARAISSGADNEPTTLLADFGRARTGFAVLKRGIPIFTSTVLVGGEAIAALLMKKVSLSAAEVEHFTDEEGLLAEGKEKSAAVEALQSGVSAFTDEVARHFHYWDTRRNDKGERMTPVGKVFLVGGSANIKGLADYVGSRIQAPTEVPNVWQRVFSFDDYIPPIDRKASLHYATAIGLALRGL